jgi:carbonic anhydrase/acetyltransferase-like protein (isoleucine patch superfamily)
MVAAGAVVRNRMEVPEGALAVGVPAQIKEGASSQEAIDEGAALYVWNAKRYRTALRLL